MIIVYEKLQGNYFFEMQKRPISVVIPGVFVEMGGLAERNQINPLTYV